MRAINDNMSKASIQKLNIRLNNLYQLQDELKSKLTDVVKAAKGFEEEEPELAEMIRSDAEELRDKLIVDEENRILLGEEIKGVPLKNEIK